MKTRSEQKIIQYCGISHGESGIPTLEYNPYEFAVIFRDGDDKGEVWLEPTKMKLMIDELSDFVKTLEFLGVKQDNE